MVQILKEIYADIELANCLGFKGGTAMMFFYDLPRFSVDMDFNLLCNKKEDIVITRRSDNKTTCHFDRSR